MENQPMLDLAWHVGFRFHVHPQQATGDTTYGTLENIQALEDMGIRAYVPLPDWEHKTPYFGPSQFAYDAARDVYVCPQGQLLWPRQREEPAGLMEYRPDPGICPACPLQAACTPSSGGGRCTATEPKPTSSACASTTTGSRTRRRCASARCESSRSLAKESSGTAWGGSASISSGA
jgi:hypothetical protein